MARSVLSQTCRALAVVSALTCICCSTVATAQIPSTQLTTVTPAGAKFGTAVDVTVAGGDQDDLTQLVFSHPGITASQKMSAAGEFLPAKPVNNQFTVSIAGDVPPGVYEARVLGRFGVSNPRAFVVGVYDEVAEKGGNNATTSAMEVGLDQTINGRVDGNTVDYFKLSLKEGQRVLINCLAERIDSRLDGTLLMLDSTGKELLRSRDYDGLDPFLDFTAPAEGDYFVGLYDFVYRGGAEYFYRLTVHLGPHVDFIFPPSGQPGTNAEYTIYGRRLPGGTPVAGLTIDGQQVESLTINIPLPGAEASSELAFGDHLPTRGAMLDSFQYRLNTAVPAPIHYARAPVVKEQEPNDQPGQAQTVSVPCEYVGQFYPARDFDYLQFEAKKGEAFYVELISHRLGMTVDPYLVVQRVTKNDKGEETVANVATVDDPGDRNGRIGSNYDTSTDDPIYRLAVSADGIYRIQVRDQFGGSIADPRRVYRLVIRPAEPDFRVAVFPERIQAPANANTVALGTAASIRRGGTTMFQVRVDRREGFAGQVEVNVEGLPAGVTCPTAYVAANASTVPLIFTATEDAAPWSGTIQVVGKSTAGDKEVVRYARAGTTVWNTGNRAQQPPAFRVARNLAFSVIDKDAEKAFVQIGEDKIWETSRGGKLELPVKVVRRGDFKGDVTLVANNVPNEIKPGNLAVKGDAAEAKLAINVTNKNAKVGLYNFYMRVDTKIKHNRNPDAVARAQADQKALTDAVAQLTEQQKQTNANKAATAKAATDAANALKAATDAKNAADAAAKAATDAAAQATTQLAAAKDAAAKDAANGDLAKAAAAAEKAKADADAKQAAAAEKQKAAVATLADADAKSKAAAEAKAAAEKAAADLDAKLKRAQTEKGNIDKTVAAVTKANNPVDKNVAFISTPIRLRIVDTPLKVSATAPTAALKQGEKLELPVALERLYGHAEAAEVTLELPGGLKGVTADKVTIAPDAKDGKFTLTADADATPGDHTITVRVKAKFNGIDVQASQPVVVKVAAAQ